MHLANTKLSNKYVPQNVKKHSLERNILHNKIKALPVQTTLRLDRVLKLNLNKKKYICTALCICKKCRLKDALRISCFDKFRKINKKTPMMEFFFKSCWLQGCKVTERKTLYRRCFAEDFVKYFETPPGDCFCIY